MSFGTNEVNEILKAWVNNYIEDVPADHSSGEYMINYHTLIEHINDLDYDTQVNVMLAAQEELVVDY